MRAPGPPSAPAQPFATAAGGSPAAGRLLAWLLLLTLALTGLTAAPGAAHALSDAQQLVVEAWRLVNEGYVAPERLATVDWRRLRQKTLERPISSSEQAYDAIEAMLAPIGDSYTRLLRPAEYATLRSNTRGLLSGVGLQLALRPEDPGAEPAIVVIAPLDDSPAAEAGIAPGTEVLRVNGRSARELGLEGTAAMLRGPVGSEVLVELRPPGGREREAVLERRQVDLKPVRARRLVVNGHTLGLLRITQFSEPVPKLVRQALADLEGAGGAPAVEGLLLDLRNNSGGLVSAGLAVADALLDGEPVVVTEDRGGIAAPLQAGAGALYSGPILALVNSGTASASEILAGALQDDGRAQLAGSRTFGKGLIQTLLPLGDGSGLAVTVARYLTPNGRDINERGIEPDHLLGPPEPLTPGVDADTWLTEAGQLLLHALH